MYFTGLTCRGCAAHYGPDRDLLLCPTCHNLLEAEYDYEGIKSRVDRDQVAASRIGVWRWASLLPVLDPKAIVSLGEGDTPMLRCDRLAEAVGVRELWLMSDAANPTGSLKDRSVTVAASKAVEFGYRVLSCDSTGNKASSVAAYAARAGMESIVFCPEHTPAPKTTQAVFLGAKLMRVRGHYAEVNAMYRRLIASGKVKWYDCGTDNPYRYEGKKSYAYEIVQHLGWRMPDRVLFPAAGGMALAKAWKGFDEMRRVGWAEGELPRMTAVQAANCAPIVKAFDEKAERVAAIEKGPTIATAIAGANPGLLGDLTLRALYESAGSAVGVTDDEIFEAVTTLGKEGLFIEPSGAVTLAGLRRQVADGTIGRDERVVCVLTGSGFKDFDLLASRVQLPARVIGSYEEMEAEAVRA
jgi:threonine synthase